jgi:hypothetical protein
MGITSSRTFLFKPPAPRKSEVYPKPDFTSIAETDRLVRDELRKETQRGFFNKGAKARNRVSILQVPSEGIQQEDVRSILSLEANQVSRHGHHGRPTQLF